MWICLHLFHIPRIFNKNVKEAANNTSKQEAQEGETSLEIVEAMGAKHNWKCFKKEVQHTVHEGHIHGDSL